MHKIYSKNPINVCIDSKPESKTIDATIYKPKSTRPVNSVLHTKEYRMHCLVYISFIHILQSADIETNPGPRIPKYLCQICSKVVTWKQRGVACDDCDKWSHIKCINMPTVIYVALQDVSWTCISGGMPNFASSLFQTTISSEENSSYAHDKSVSSIGSPGPPISCSSPIKQNKH